MALANPWRARRFAAALGLLAKPDTIDTAALATYGTAFLDMPATPPRSQFLDQFAGLLVPREARDWAETAPTDTAWPHPSVDNFGSAYRRRFVTGAGRSCETADSAHRHQNGLKNLGTVTG